jgi:hypothetical protein
MIQLFTDLMTVWKMVLIFVSLTVYVMEQGVCVGEI